MAFPHAPGTLIRRNRNRAKASLEEPLDDLHLLRRKFNHGRKVQERDLSAPSLLEGSRPVFVALGRCRIGLRRGSLELCQDFAQRRNQLSARNMTFLELNPELKCLRRRLELKDERPWPLRSRLLFAAFAARLIAGQPSLHDAVETRSHFFFGGLTRNLQQQRLG